MTTKLTYIALITTVVAWASSFVGIRIGLHGFSPGAMALLRYLVASAIMLVVYAKLPNKQPINPSEYVLLFLLGVIGMGLYNMMLNLGERTVTSSVTSFIASQIPVVTILLAHFALKEPFSKKAWVGLIISILGIVVIALSENAFTFDDHGVWFIVVSVFCMGFYSAYQKPMLKKISALQMTCFTIWFGTVSLLGYSHQMFHEVRHASLKPLLWVMYIGAVPTALAYVCWGYAISKIPTCKAASFLYFTPIVTTFLAWGIIGELPKMMSLLGGVIAIVGAVVIRRFA